MVCLTGAKFTMSARVLKPLVVTGDSSYDPAFAGGWEESQDPLTGEVVTRWEPSVKTDDPGTPEINESDYNVIACVARGYSTATRFSSTQVFSDTYKNIDMVRMWVPANAVIDKDDRISHIADQEGNFLWPDVVFNVTGVTPQLGPFNVVTEKFLMLERTEV